MVDREKGSNALRGGKNIYAAKTKVGNWVEEEYKPGVPTRGFSTRRFVTTTVHQQLDGCGRSTTEVEGFGVGVGPGVGENEGFGVGPGVGAKEGTWVVGAGEGTPRTRSKLK